MRSNEERIMAMHQRAAELEKEKRSLRARLLTGLSLAACLVLVIGMAVVVSTITAPVPEGSMAGKMSASIFGSGSTLGLLAVGIVAFLLGITVTLFCQHLKKSLDGRKDS